MFKTRSLPAPWGVCGTTKLDYYNSSDEYTMAKCQLESDTKSLEIACGCKGVNMPGL